MRLIVLLTFIFVFTSLATSQQHGAVLIRDVRVFDGEQVLLHRNVLLRDGRIARVGGSQFDAEGAEVIEGQGKTLLPGLIDAHVHVPEDLQDALGQALSLGVTTVLDMFNGGDRFKVMKRVQSEDPQDIADVRTAGIGATSPGGHPTQMGGPFAIPTISGPEEAQAFVDARIAEGSDYIKIIYDDLAGTFGPANAVPKPTAETLRALIKAAHVRDKLAVVHISTEQQAREAITAGADGLVHMFTGESVSRDFGRLAGRHGIFVVPTLSTVFAICGDPDGPRLLKDPNLNPFIRPAWRAGLEQRLGLTRPPSCKATREGLTDLIRAKVPILAGTDAPVPGTTYGASLHGELALLVRSGLSPVQALAAATSIPAGVFGLKDRGRIRSGMRADLVLVEGNPTREIRATRNIKAVWKRSIRVDR